MKRGMTVVLGTILLGIGAAHPMAQGGQGGRGRGPAAPACTTVACDVQGDWERNRGLLVGIAEAMPEDKFGFKPTPAQQSFGERIIHVAGIDVKLLGTLGGK